MKRLPQENLRDVIIARRVEQHCVDTMRLLEKLRETDPARAARIAALRVSARKNHRVS